MRGEMRACGVERSVETVWKIIAAIAAYLVGSINFATVFAKIRHVNIRAVGSKNPGTMNVLRSVGKLWGVLTFVCDAAKGVAFALIGMYAVGKSTDWLFIFGLITIAGHVFPIYTRFKGGKGVATSIGVFMVANPIVASVVLVGLIVALFALKYGFIGSLVSISVLTVWQCVISRDSLSVILVCITIWLLVVVSHRSNIVRILQGKENTLDLFKKPKSPRGSDGAQGAQTDASQTQQADPVSDGDAAQTRDSENE